MQKDVSFIENRVSSKGSLWKKRADDLENISLLKNANDIPDIIATILAGRHIEADDVNDFLYPEVNKLLKDPSCLFDLDNGIDCLVSAIRNNEISIVSGLPGTGKTYIACAEALKLIK